MIGLAVALLAAQEVPLEWVRVTETERSVIEVADVRADGDRRNLSVRATSLERHQAVVASIIVNCATRTSWMEGDGKLYLDGKFEKTVAAPASVHVERPVAGDPVAEPVLDFACAL